MTYLTATRLRLCVVVALTATTLAACGSARPAAQACSRFSVEALSAAIGLPVTTPVSTVSDSGPPAIGGCRYLVVGHPAPSLEVWVLTHNAKSMFDSELSGARQQPGFVIESGPGFEAFQTSLDTAVLKNGTYIDFVSWFGPTQDQAATTYLPKEALAQLRAVALKAVP